MDVGDKPEEDDENYETMIEWLMVTRSDPGGSVPRFMIERGTPPGIAGDANKFLKWLSSKSISDFSETDGEDTKLKQEASKAEVAEKLSPDTPSYPRKVPTGPRPSVTEEKEELEEALGPTGFYGMIANALNAAGSVATSHLPIIFSSTKDASSDSSEPSSELREDDESSIHSFHSLEAEGIDENDNASSKPEESSTQLTPSVTNGGAEWARSTDSLARSTAPSQHEKELRKLEERKRKTEEKLRRAQEKALAKRGNASETSSQREEAALQKLREKHEREMAKQQEKYEREMKKLEAKKANEQKKAEERQRKALEREEKANLAMELDKVRAERDIARKQMEILKEQIGDLQTQNTLLVARLGREGISLDEEGLNGGAKAPGIKRAATEGMAERGARRASTLRS